jgi:hypothetical protein
VRVADLVVTATGVLRDAIAAGLLDAGDVPGEIRAVLGDTPQMAVATLVDDVVATSTDRPEAALSPTAAAALAALRQFVDAAVLERDPVRGERDRALYCVASLAVHLLEEHADAADPATTVTDAISALTDDGVLSEFGRRFLPGS